MLAALRQGNTVLTEEIAAKAFEASALTKTYLAAAQALRNTWARCFPLLGLAPALRKVVYTTKATEPLNYQLRTFTKPNPFPNDQAAVNLLWLAICDIIDKRALVRSMELACNTKRGESTGTVAATV